MIRLDNVSKTYHKGDGAAVQALREVSIEIERGEFVAIVGPSGSGKSTLMNIIGLLDRPDSGSYSFDGREAAGLGVNELARLRNESIGFVFQAFHLLPKTTALENVELPLVYSERRGLTALARKALESVGLKDRESHNPSELSGGEQQRVAIARALVNEPDVILADEPTGNLDSTSGGEILSLVSELHQAGRTIVLITHDAAVAGHAQRTLSIADGCIVADTGGEA